MHAFDPTPASFDGTLDFYSPRKDSRTRYSHERRGRPFDRRKPIAGRVQRLSTIMRGLGHDRINVLKIDVEGSEFEVIPDLVESGIPVDQLLVEIHYRFRFSSVRR